MPVTTVSTFRSPISAAEISAALIGDRKVETVVTGIRPGEKVHEVLVSEEEAYRTFERGQYYVIRPMLPELVGTEKPPKPLGYEYSSADRVMESRKVVSMLEKHKLMVGDRFVYEEDMLA